MPATAEDVRTAPRSIRTETKRRPESARSLRMKLAAVRHAALVERLKAKAKDADEGRTIDLTGLDSEGLRASLFGG